MKNAVHPSNTRHQPPVKNVLGQVTATEIHITDTHVRGLPVVVSFWHPSKDEVQKILQGWPVALVIAGENMPGALVTVLPPGGEIVVQ